MRQTLIFLFFCVLILTACKTKKRILIGSSIAEGNIGIDTILNGRIKYYDTLSNKLNWEADYDKSILHGQIFEYYKNGKVKVKGYYRDGKKYGFVKFFDSTGVIQSEQFYYYNLMVGSATDFVNGEPKEYSFNSLDNRQLFYLNYDSIVGKKIQTMQKGFFFYNVFEKADIISLSNPRREYFLYLINPPKFRFSYSLCIIKDNFEIVDELKIFDNLNAWATFDTDQKLLKPREQFAIRLTIDDDINEQSDEMFKRIE